MKETYS